MAEDWAAVALEAEAGIAEVGGPATLTKRLPGDPATWSSGGERSLDAVAVIDESSAEEVSARDGRSEAVKLLVGAHTLREAPEVTDKLTFAGVTYEVRSVVAVAPSGLPVVYEVEALR